jgi:hypothetical protein
MRTVRNVAWPPTRGPPIGAANLGDVAENHVSPGATCGVAHVDVAVVAHTLRQGMRRETTLGIDQDETHPRVIAIGRRSRIGDGRAQPVDAGRHFEREHGVVVLQTLIVGKLRTAGLTLRRSTSPSDTMAENELTV